MHGKWFKIVRMKSGFNDFVLNLMFLIPFFFPVSPTQRCLVSEYESRIQWFCFEFAVIKAKEELLACPETKKLKHDSILENGEAVCVK